MDGKYKVNDLAKGDSPENDGKAKEGALEKLRKMEWKRNTQDSWHLARSNSRGCDIQEKKKYNKDEDNYFEGTGVQKTKRFRKPRVVEKSPTIPPGFSTAQAAPCPPQVNAWAQKKGSALFHKEDEVDEEDLLMKQVIQASIKSAAEEESKRYERMRMTNLDIPATSQSIRAERDGEEEYKYNDFHTNHNQDDLADDSAQAELHFVETNVKGETPSGNQRHRSIPPRTRKISPQEKPKSPNQKVDFPESGSKASTITKNTNYRSPETTMNKPVNNEFFEPSCPQEKSSKSSEKERGPANQFSSRATHSDSNNSPRIVAKHDETNLHGLKTSLNSTLTFGDTQGILENIQENNNVQKLHNNTPSLAAAEINSAKMSTNPNEPSEIDIIFHNYIRLEPPSNVNSVDQAHVSNLYLVKQPEQNELFAMPDSPTLPNPNLNPESLVTQQVANPEQHPVTNGYVGNPLIGGIQINGRDSSSSLSGSPMGTNTPFGSLEQEMPYSMRTGVQVPSQIGTVSYPHSHNVESQERLIRQLQEMHLLNQNPPLAVNTDYSAVTTPVGGVMGLNPQLGQPQYRLPNSSMIPPYQGQSHHFPSMLMQQQQSQLTPGYYSQTQMMALEAARLQQSLLSSGIAESGDNMAKEEATINQAQIPNSNLSPYILPQIPQPQIYQQPPQSQILSQMSQAQILAQAQAQILAHSKAQMMPQPQNLSQMLLQNHLPAMPILTQPQTGQSEKTSPKQEELLLQHGQASKAQSGGKTEEELQTEYQNAFQLLMRLQEEMHKARVQPTVPIAQTQSTVSMTQIQPTMPQVQPTMPMAQVQPTMPMAQVQPAMPMAQVQPTMPMAQVQPPWGVMPSSPALISSSAGNQFFPMGIVRHIHPQMMQQSQNASLMSPTIQQPSQNPAGTLNANEEIDLGSEMNTAQGPPQTAIGRGRGRLY